MLNTYLYTSLSYFGKKNVEVKSIKNTEKSVWFVQIFHENKISDDSQNMFSTLNLNGIM